MDNPLSQRQYRKLKNAPIANGVFSNGQFLCDLATGSLSAITAEYTTGHRLMGLSSGPASNAITYDRYRVSTLSSGSCEYEYSYDGAGEPSSIELNTDSLFEWERGSDGSACLVEKTLFANGYEERRWVDPWGRELKRLVGGSAGSVAFKAYYQDVDGLDSTIDWLFPESNLPSSGARLRRIEYLSASGAYVSRDYAYRVDDGRPDSVQEGARSFNYSYGAEGEVTYVLYFQKRIARSGTSTLRVETDYAGIGSAAIEGKKRKTELPGLTLTEQVRPWSFSEDETSSVIVLNAAGNPTANYFRSLSFCQDSLGRVTHFPSGEAFEYGNGSSAEGERSISYSWNANGMLTSISSSSSNGYGFSQTFSYDSYGRLAAETSPSGISQSYSYDARGNITSKVMDLGGFVGYSIRTYDAKDRLLSMTDFPGSNAFSYDVSGYPIRYKNKNLSWDGPKMVGFDGSSYSYDGLGRLVEIQGGGRSVTLDYLLDELGSAEITISNVTNKLEFAYGPSGLIGFAYSGQFYAFHKNILGDIVALYCDGLLVTQYRYDAWGNCQVLTASGLADTNPSSPGNLNPFRYRGAYFDAYSNLYLMGTRPYDPDTGRFICPDDPAYLDPASLEGLNLYAYCLNNPVMYLDPSGHLPIVAFLIGLGILAGTGIGLTVSGRLLDNEVLTNIGNTMISIAEIIGGVFLIANGIGGIFGTGLLGTGIGSITNGSINQSNGGSYYAGWAGGQLSGALSFLIPYFGGGVGAFAGSILTDFIDANHNVSNIDWEKAAYSGLVAFALSWLDIVIRWGGGELSKAARFVLSYESALIGISNSIVNVFWRGRKKC